MDILKKYRWLCFLLVLGPALFGGCSKAVDPWKDVPGGPTKVLVTIPPLYCFAKNVAGDDAAVLCLLASQGPHDYHPTVNDVIKAQKADLFLSIGLGLDDFVDKVANSSGNSKLEIIAVGDKALKPNKLLIASDEKEEKHEKDDDHDHGAFDPHVWLGIRQAIQMVDHISATLQRIDAKHKDGYARRAANYKKELEKLHQDGLEALKGKKNKKLITTHDSLRYFADSFKLEIVDSIQFRPGSEPEAGKIAKLVKLSKDQKVPVIAIEPQFPSTHAEILKKQLKGDGVQVELVEIDPMETVAPDLLNADYYVAKMRQNITTLAKKLP